MEAIILPHENEGKNLPCGVESSLLLPLLNKHALWYVMTMLTDWGVTAVTFAPEQPEEKLTPLLANGDRWGVKVTFPKTIRDIFQGEEKDPIDSETMDPDNNENCLILETGWVGSGDLPELISCKGNRGFEISSNCPEVGGSKISLWVMSRSVFKQVCSESDSSKRLTGNYFRELVTSRKMDLIEIESSIVGRQISTIDSFLMSNLDALTRRLPLMTSNAKEVSPGIFIGAGTTIDPSASLTGPLYIGNDCVVGAGVKLCRSFIGSGAAIGSDSIIMNSVVGSDTFVGNLTQMQMAFANKNCLHKKGNTEWIEIEDSFLLSDINAPIDLSFKEIVKGVIDLAKDHFSEEA